MGLKENCSGELPINPYKNLLGASFIVNAFYFLYSHNGFRQQRNGNEEQGSLSTTQTQTEWPGSSVEQATARRILTPRALADISKPHFYCLFQCKLLVNRTMGRLCRYNEIMILLLLGKSWNQKVRVTITHP